MLIKNKTIFVAETRVLFVETKFWLLTQENDQSNTYHGNFNFQFLSSSIQENEQSGNCNLVILTPNTNSLALQYKKMSKVVTAI